MAAWILGWDVLWKTLEYNTHASFPNAASPTTGTSFSEVVLHVCLTNPISFLRLQNVAMVTLKWEKSATVGPEWSAIKTAVKSALCLTELIAVTGPAAMARVCSTRGDTAVDLL